MVTKIWGKIRVIKKFAIVGLEPQGFLTASYFNLTVKRWF